MGWSDFAEATSKLYRIPIEGSREVLTLRTTPAVLEYRVTWIFTGQGSPRSLSDAYYDSPVSPPDFTFFGAIRPDPFNHRRKVFC